MYCSTKNLSISLYLSKTVIFCYFVTFSTSRAGAFLATTTRKQRAGRTPFVTSSSCSSISFNKRRDYITPKSISATAHRFTKGAARRAFHVWFCRVAFNLILCCFNTRKRCSEIESNESTELRKQREATAESWRDREGKAS